MGCMMGLPMRLRRSLTLALPLLVLGLAVAGCGALGDTETAAEADAAVVVADAVPAESAAEAEGAPVEEVPVEEPAASAEEAVAAPAPDNAAAWAVIDRGAQRFAARLDEATQAIASCQTEAAAGADFTACQNASFAAVAEAGDAFIAVLDEAAATAGGDCRAALEGLRGATGEMAADYRGAIDMTDLTSLETAYLEMAADAGAYADAAMAAAGACGG